MSLDNNEQLDSTLIEGLRALALHGTSPSGILRCLAQHIVDQDTFVNYMMEAFLDDGDVWSVANRWWHGDMSEQGADVFLRAIFEQRLAAWRAEGYSPPLHRDLHND